TESWIYIWIGYTDQRLVKLLSPLFFVSALAMFYAVNRRKGWSSFSSPMLLMTIPLLWFSSGSTTSGYADFPLAVFYLAAVAYLLEYRQTGDWVKLRLAGFLLAAGCWIKREGAILWLCVVVIAAISAMKNREGPNSTEKGEWNVKWYVWKRWFYVAFPGLAVI